MLSKMRQWNNPALRGQFYRLRQQVGQVQTQLQENSATLKELETRLVNPQLLLSEIVNSEKPYFHQSKKLCNNIQNSSETVMSKWLTQTHSHATFDPTDIQIIRQLMAWGISEFKAKNALARAYNQNDVIDAFGLFNKFRTRQYRFLPEDRLFPEAQRWPMINDVNEVMNMGKLYDGNTN